ncbi:MAG: hypothetical protein K5695_09010 [Oscillospiraceae bacterium]|nr:hypothetical protein [Oscillospiraceae bacterium]
MAQKPAPRKPAPKKPKAGASQVKKPLSPIEEKRREQRNGIIVTITAGVVGAAAVAAILTFLCQNGLNVINRCNCSWEKVILYSILTFVACILHVVPYLQYREQKRQFNLARTEQVRKPIKRRMDFWLIAVTAIIMLVSLLIIFILIPLFQDQNGNFLWFFTRGGGILSVVVMLLASVFAGVFGKLFLTEHV